MDNERLAISLEHADSHQLERLDVQQRGKNAVKEYRQALRRYKQLYNLTGAKKGEPAQIILERGRAVPGFDNHTGTVVAQLSPKTRPAPSGQQTYGFEMECFIQIPEAKYKYKVRQETLTDRESAHGKRLIGVQPNAEWTKADVEQAERQNAGQIDDAATSFTLLLEHACNAELNPDMAGRAQALKSKLQQEADSIALASETQPPTPTISGGGSFEP